MIIDNEFKETRPLFQQIIDYVEDQIIQQKWVSGERIPSVRELGETLGVNPNTCVKAYEIMTEQNIVEPQRGTGYWVCVGAKDKLFAAKHDEMYHKMIPLIILTLRKYNIRKDSFIQAINDLYDDPNYLVTIKNQF